MTQRFTLTLDQIKDIFTAGERWGEESATAYQCGANPCGKRIDALTDALHEVVNEVPWDSPHYVQWETVKNWMK
jgi:hypothetical protein